MRWKQRFQKIFDTSKASGFMDICAQNFLTFTPSTADAQWLLTSQTYPLGAAEILLLKKCLILFR